VNFLDKNSRRFQTMKKKLVDISQEFPNQKMIAGLLRQRLNDKLTSKDSVNQWELGKIIHQLNHNGFKIEKYVENLFGQKRTCYLIKGEEKNG